MDRFEQMRAFACIVEAGGFSRATARAGMSRAALSKHVQQLEERLDARLLNRTTRRVSLTEAGRRFYAQSRRILDDVSNAESAMTRAGAEPAGELRVVAPTNFGLTLLGPAISEFLLAYRDISMDLSLNDQPVDPIDAGYDIAIRVIVGNPQDSTSLRAVRLSTSRRILCASPDYLARRGTPRQPEDLTDHECLSYSYVDDPRLWRLASASDERAVRVSGPIVTSAIQVLRLAAARGLGIASGPILFFRDDIDAGRVVRVLPTWELPVASIYAFYPVGRRPSPKVAAFNAFMQRFFDGRFL